MRVVSGNFKGRKLKAPKNNLTRPTENKVKEAIFDMLYPIDPQSTALDLFAGSGQIGIEFMSRGLKKVYLNDFDRASFRILKENTYKFDKNTYMLTNKDFKKALRFYKENDITFDYIYLDPPFDSDYYKISIQLINDYELLNEDGIVITESDKKLNLDEKYKLFLIKEKVYGRKIVNIYQK